MSQLKNAYQVSVGLNGHNILNFCAIHPGRFVDPTPRDACSRLAQDPGPGARL